MTKLSDKTFNILEVESIVRWAWEEARRQDYRGDFLKIYDKFWTEVKESLAQKEIGKTK